jgi:hypothetical protein
MGKACGSLCVFQVGGCFAWENLWRYGRYKNNEEAYHLKHGRAVASSRLKAGSGHLVADLPVSRKGNDKLAICNVTT